jgi:hypothetical protein
MGQDRHRSEKQRTHGNHGEFHLHQDTSRIQI